MSKLENAPEEVLEVHRLLVENAIERFDKEFGNDAVYTRESSDGSWIVGPNFENYGNSMIYKPEEGWFYRESWSGVDKAMRSGYEEAKGNARCFFTG